MLGAVFLVVTGGEALYADMGHFGRKPIRLAWFVDRAAGAVSQLSRTGRDDPARSRPPHRHRSICMAPRWALYPLVVLATMAAIIASQALISGAFSLTRQAIQLGYSPRLDIQYTSSHHQGQIYIPQVNWALMFATLGLVLGFRSSSALAAAYGIAVTLTMLITTMLAYLVARGAWGVRRLWPDRSRCSSCSSSWILRRQPDQDCARRLVPAGHRRDRLHRALDLENGPRAARRSVCASGSIRSIGSCRTSKRTRRSGCRGRRSS